MLSEEELTEQLTVTPPLLVNVVCPLRFSACSLLIHKGFTAHVLFFNASSPNLV
jgi:hypothetical protein